MLTLTLVWVIVLVLVLMLVTAPVVDGRVVNNPPIGHVSVPLLPVIQEVTVDVVKTVVVPGFVVANAGTELDVFGLLGGNNGGKSMTMGTSMSTTTDGRMGKSMPTDKDGRIPTLTPDGPISTPTGRVSETPTSKIGLLDGPTTMLPSRPMQRAMVLASQVGYELPADVVRVTSPDGSEIGKDGMRVVAGSVEDRVPPGKSDDRTDETPFTMWLAT